MDLKLKYAALIASYIALVAAAGVVFADPADAKDCGPTLKPGNGYKGQIEMPPEWREPGFEPLLTAWLDGFDRTERPD